MQWGCALAGEVGELCNMLKKYQRQMPTDPSPDELHAEIGKEIADVFIYLDLLASTFDFDSARVIALKFNATSKKFGFPERL
jgi:NTP pyrophosphatase (non-canonical NTP hydrolase)